MSSEDPDCQTRSDLISLGCGLPRFAGAIKQLERIEIVAIGSSSTAGEGASAPDKTYPGRLTEALVERFPGPAFSMHNAGVGGQEAPDEAARFGTDVIACNPSLVIWQIGTNAAWKNYDLDDVRQAILRGIDHLEGTDADLVLMNLQYAPALLDAHGVPKPATVQMLGIIDEIAARREVAVFRRFEIMRHWHVERRIPFGLMISNKDGNWLHQTDWSYNCIAQALCSGLAEAVTRAGSPSAV